MAESIGSPASQPSGGTSGAQKAARAASEAAQVAKATANIAKGAAAGGVGGIAAAGVEFLKNPKLFLKVIGIALIFVLLPIVLIVMLPLLIFGMVANFIAGVLTAVGSFFRSLPILGAVITFFIGLFGGGAPEPETYELPEPIPFENAFDMAHLMYNLEDAHEIIGDAHLTQYIAIQEDLAVIIAELPDGDEFVVITPGTSGTNMTAFGTASVLGMYAAALHYDVLTSSHDDLEARVNAAGSHPFFLLEGPEILPDEREVTPFYPPSPPQVAHVENPDTGEITTPGWVWSERISDYRPVGWLWSEDVGGYIPPPPDIITINVHTFTISYVGERVFADLFGIGDDERLMTFAREYARNLMILLTDMNMGGAFNMQEAGIVEGFYSPFPGMNWQVTSHYGWRIHPITGADEYHTGVDLRVPNAPNGRMLSGTPIRAVATGQVTFSGWMGGYGNTVIIDHGDIRGDGAHYTSLYAHNSSNNVAQWQWVEAGDVIAFAGSTGVSTGVHLHLEIRRNGVTQNPLAYIGAPP